MPSVAGVEIASEAEVARLVEQQLQGTGPWSDRNDYTPVDGLVRALRGAGGLTPAFARALLGLLEHDDAAVRAGAVASLTDVADHISADDLVRALEAHPDHFRGVKPPAGYPVPDEDLESRLVVAIARAMSPSDALARQFLMEQARNQHSVSALLGLSRTDPDWVAAHADTVVPRNAIGGILRAIPGRAQRRSIVSALSPWPLGDGQALLQSKAWTSLPIPDDERAELAALISGGKS
jgi:hypothetical protein